MTDEELIEKVLPVYEPERFWVLGVIDSKEEVERNLKNELKRNQALDHLNKFYIFSKHFYDYEKGRIPDREEQKEVKMTMPAHENDIGITKARWNQMIVEQENKRKRR